MIELNKKYVGKALKLIRQYHNMSQTQLGKNLLGCTRQRVSYMESGRSVVLLQTLHKYSDAFTISVWDILYLAKEMQDGIDPRATLHSILNSKTNKENLNAL